MRYTIKKSISVSFLLLLLVLPFLFFPAAGTKGVAFSITNKVDKSTANVEDP